jgi:hypothetical protein
MNRYYVYAFLDKSKPGKFKYENFEFDFEPFYIGKGTGDRIYHSQFDKYNNEEGMKYYTYSLNLFIVYFYYHLL